MGVLFELNDYTTSLETIKNDILSVIKKDEYDHKEMRRNPIKITMYTIDSRPGFVIEKESLFIISYSLLLDPYKYRHPSAYLITRVLYESKIPKGFEKKGAKFPKKPIEILISRILNDVVDTIKRHDIYARRKHAVALFNTMSKRPYFNGANTGENTGENIGNNTVENTGENTGKNTGKNTVENIIHTYTGHNKTLHTNIYSGRAPRPKSKTKSKTRSKSKTKSKTKSKKLTTKNLTNLANSW